MPLSPGTRLGPYDIVSPLGAGGMGEVYKALDTRLGRTVAIKILSADMACDLRSRERFRREARAISGLTHPNICTLYDVGEEHAVEFLVMEYLPGETLAHRLLRGALPLEDALRIAVQLADALDTAHGTGLTHRDLKPANIMLTTGGAKVLDFGLAKWHGTDQDSAIGVAQGAAHPTVTQVGTIVGTIQYMAPEQVEGRSTDARSDLFALGAIVYEMVTGRKAFEGATASSVTAAILTSTPPAMATVNAAIPASFDRVVRKCLAKDRSGRWQTAADLRDELAWIAQDLHSQSESGLLKSPATPNRWALVAIGLVAAALIITGTLVWRAAEQGVSTPVYAAKLTLLPPDRTSFDSVLVAPNGRQIAFTAADPAGRLHLWVRSLDELSVRSLTGTEDAVFPFWSPDGQSIGFVAGGQLKTVRIDGGQVDVICPATNSRGGSWSRDGTILLAPDAAGPLYRTKAAPGSLLEPVTRLDDTTEEISQRWPSFLPDGHHYLYAVRSAKPSVAGIYVGDIGSASRKRLRPEVSNAVYVGSPDGVGRVLFARDRTVLAQRFDVGHLQLAGEPEVVAEDTAFAPGLSLGAYSVSQTGVLAFTTGLPKQAPDLAWFDRAGRRVGNLDTDGKECNRAALSPDERSVALDCIDSQSGQRDVWAIDLTRGVKSHLATGVHAVWSPDSQRVVFATGLAAAPKRDIIEMEANGSGRQRTLVSNTPYLPLAWSPDNRFLLLRSAQDLTLLPLADARAGQRSPYRRLAGGSDIARLLLRNGSLGAMFSPDGKWIAYNSYDSGRLEVFVEAFVANGDHQDRGERWQVSDRGGELPRWRRDGQELLYFSQAESAVKSVELKRFGATLEPRAPTTLFTVKLVAELPTPQFNVTGDGQRFLIQVAASGPQPSTATIILNWPAALQK